MLVTNLTVSTQVYIAYTHPVGFIGAFVFYIEHYVLTWRKNGAVTILKFPVNYTGSDVERDMIRFYVLAISIDSRKMWEGRFL